MCPQQQLRTSHGITNLIMAQRLPMRDGSHGAAPFIVDDDAVARQLIVMMLDRLRLADSEVRVPDINDVLEWLRRCAAGEMPVPALVMSDCSMPGRSGLQVLRWIRT